MLKVECADDQHVCCANIDLAYFKLRARLCQRHFTTTRSEWVFLGREETSEFGPADAKTVELQQNAGFSLKKERKKGRDSGFMKTFDQQKRHLCCFVFKYARSVSTPVWMIIELKQRVGTVILFCNPVLLE